MEEKRPTIIAPSVQPVESSRPTPRDYFVVLASAKFPLGWRTMMSLFLRTMRFFLGCGLGEKGEGGGDWPAHMPKRYQDKESN
jgi:hypothetical protein